MMMLANHVRGVSLSGRRLVLKSGFPRRSLVAVRQLYPTAALSSSSASSSSASSSSSVYLNDSSIPTMHFQASLPRMPIPPLEETVQKYLTALEPIVNEEQLAEAKLAAEEFLSEGGRGKDLHSQLVARDAANPHTSYINSWWFDMYVGDRRPLPLNSNPQLLFEDDPREEKQNSTARAADFIYNSVRFKMTLDAGKLEPECFHIKPKPAWFDTVMRLIPSGMQVPFRNDSLHSAVGFLVGAFPLDMSQFRHMFSTTRVPRQGKDEIVKAEEVSGEPLRVLVSSCVACLLLLLLLLSLLLLIMMCCCCGRVCWFAGGPYARTHARTHHRCVRLSCCDVAAAAAAAAAAAVFLWSASLARSSIRPSVSLSFCLPIG